MGVAELRPGCPFRPRKGIWERLAAVSLALGSAQPREALRGTLGRMRSAIVVGLGVLGGLAIAGAGSGSGRLVGGAAGRVWPVRPYRGVISPFGASRDDGTRVHAGVDLGALPGDAIVAMTEGVVLYPVSGFSIGAGLQAVAVRHPDAEYVYAEILLGVTVGQVLAAGQRIGTAAKNKDGNSMLHLEAWEHAPHAFTRWVTGARPAGLLDVQARLPAKS